MVVWVCCLWFDLRWFCALYTRIRYWCCSYSLDLVCVVLLLVCCFVVFVWPLFGVAISLFGLTLCDFGGVMVVLRFNGLLFFVVWLLVIAGFCLMVRVIALCGLLLIVLLCAPPF